MAKSTLKRPNQSVPLKNPFIKATPARELPVSPLLIKAVTAHQKGLTREAESLYRQVLLRDPHDFNALHLLGVSLSEQGEYGQAIESISRAIELNAKSHLFFSNLGVAYKGLRLNDEALKAYNSSLKLNPNYPQALSNRGLCYLDLGFLQEALADLKKATELGPNLAYAHNNLGLVYKEMHEWRLALASYQNAVSLNPNYAEAHWNKSLLNLLLGNCVEGFRDYEWRWRNKSSPIHLEHRTYPVPVWLGEQTDFESTILIYTEQGLGDTLQFCRYLKPLSSVFKKIILHCPRSLVALLAHSMPGITLISLEDELPGFDCYCPLLSLPLALQINLTSPGQTSEGATHFNYLSETYLFVPEQKITDWAQMLKDNVSLHEKSSNLRVGLLNRGNPKHPNDHQRSIELAPLLRGLPERYSYFHLQKDISSVEAELISQYPNVYSFAAKVDDFLDTAALCMNLDLVITVDTSVAHLCAALGIRTWVLVPYTPDWRWQTEQSTTHWYPSVRLFRQGPLKDWGEVLVSAANALLELAG